MRILFVPCASAVIPHILPLIALDSKLEAGRHATAFLAPSYLHKSLRNMGRNVLDIDYRSESLFRDEMAACGRFRPDVIVDDFSLATLLITKITDKPRVTILRTGVFPGRTPRDDTHRHSSESRTPHRFDFETHFLNFEFLCGMRAPKTFSEACAADVSIIPGIRSVEELPVSLDNDKSYVFAGALSVSDASVPFPDGSDRDAALSVILAFLEKNQERKIVFLTLGTVHKAGETIRESIRYMLNAGAAVISTIDLPNLHPTLKEFFCHVPFVPMHTVCSKVNLMIHHCGSSYQYAIMHKIPSIIFGSQCYDRDDVAYRLEQLGVAKYIPANENVAGIAESFRKEFDECFDSNGYWYTTAKKRLETLKNENDQSTALFDFEAVLNQAIAMHRENAPASSVGGFAPSWRAKDALKKPSSS